jgi:hypothetical protein
MGWINYLKTASKATITVTVLAVLGMLTGSTLLIGTALAGPDKTPPTVAVTFPASSGSYRASAWATGCAAGAGVCGTAADPGGVAQVRVAVLQVATGKYWNPSTSSFSTTTQLFNVATGTTSWRLPLPTSPTLPDGSYTTYVRSTDGLGNAAASNQASLTFKLDNVAPPAPVITKKPADPSGQQNALFQFTDTEAGVDFQCSLDGGASSSCGSPLNYQHLETDDHCFAVRAVDAAGNTSGQTKSCWTLLLDGAFRITGDLGGSLSPGTSLPLNLSIQNPFNFDVKLVSVAITVAAATTKKPSGAPNPACVGNQNVYVAQPYTGAAVIPRNSTKNLQQVGVPPAQWPQIKMYNLAGDQNDCKSTVFKFTYTGSATKP